MAIKGKYTDQFSVVCTGFQKDALKRDASENNTSEAAILRELLNERYGIAADETSFSDDGARFREVVGQVGQE